jgi:signal transduction histidine kinase
LRELNAKLKTIVDEEVEKNRQKDTMLQQQARHAAMGEMIGNIAHQWRQPLGVIASITNNFITQIDLELDIKHDVLAEKLKDINTNVNYLSKTIDDFRNFLKDSQTKTTFNIASILTDSTNLAKPNYDSNYISLTTDIDLDAEYHGASSMLSQVILNLLSNAKDALIQNDIKDKKAHLSLEETEDRFIIKLKDNAGGVNDEIKDKIFDPYFTTKHQSQGTGLGLYMSSQIILNHFHGQFNVVNVEDANGLGACFIIQFPKVIPTTV